MSVSRCRVVGVTFAPGYPASFHRLLDATEACASTERVCALLVRDPANPHDPNAIRVEVPALGHHVGHVPATIAADWAPRLDAGERTLAGVDGIWVAQGHGDRPGMTLAVRWLPPDHPPTDRANIVPTADLEDHPDPDHLPEMLTEQLSQD